MKKYLITLSIFFFVLTGFAQQTIELNNWKFKPSDNLEWARPEFDDKNWKHIKVGYSWEVAGYKGYNDYGWYRIRFFLPSGLKQKCFSDSLSVVLGKIMSRDETFLNGELIGWNAKTIENNQMKGGTNLSQQGFFWAETRNYVISVDDPRLKWDKENVLSVRVHGESGMFTLPVHIKAKEFSDYLNIDIESHDWEKKVDGTLSKAISLKCLSPLTRLKGNMNVEILDANTGDKIVAKDFPVDLGSEGTVTFDFKGDYSRRMRAVYTFIRFKTKEKAFRAQALPYFPNFTGTNDISGDYYNWTKTMQPEYPLKHDYNKTLILKLFLCSRNYKGDVDSVLLRFGDIPEILQKLDNITLGLPKIVYLVGWQYNGHDSKYPSLSEVNPRLKRAEDTTALQSLRWLFKEAKIYHTAISFHINMSDAYQDSPLWDEYLAKDIIAKDNQGELITPGIGGGMPVYPISYAQEWNLGYTQKRIDGLLKMIPELKESGTIHLDAFHSMQPIRPNQPISSYLSFSINDEIAAQRKIFRYWMKQGIDVTCEGAKYWLRNDPFLGLQASTWWFDETGFAREDWTGKPKSFTSLPPALSCYTPMHCEGEIQNDPVNLNGLAEQTCMNLAPWYYKRNIDVNVGGTVILTDEEVICPALWTERAMVACNTKEDIRDRKVKLPTTWVDVKEVQLYDMTVEGLKPRAVLPVTDGCISLSINKNQPTVIKPVGK